MKKITHHYGVTLDWVEPLAFKLEGKVEGNFITVPEHIHTGDRYFLECGFGISVLYLDVVYHSDIHFRQENKNDDFIGIYYNLTEGEAVLMSDELANPIGRWNFNLAIVDSALNSDYIVTAGSHTFAVCIFIKKKAIENYLLANSCLQEKVDLILNSKKNTIIEFTRMSNESYHLLNKLKSKNIRSISFNLYLKGTVNSLLADYIEKLSVEKAIIDNVNDSDLTYIIQSQSYLIENLYQIFPGIDFLADKVNMSQTKYKNLFRKITGMTPNSFFIENKLTEAKRLLSEGQAISQISKDLNFTSSSYFALNFKKYFGMLPKDFVKQLE
ncbi:helix-turn-helix domain-containing protein [Flavobacterium sp. C3NV]|jgi:AraC-like DNA-binding protein|uniref:helix-turn-helix domain-containing protein n=1 Tax=Flavobacterium sp. C3NV TaxID=3393358 RepID=UPI00398FDBB3